MIVDDDVDFTKAVEIAMQDEGHETRIANDTEKGLRDVREYKPDLLILDVMFPGNNTGGFDLVREIREFEDDLKGLPVLMLTGVNQHFPLGLSSQNVGDPWLPATDFLEKPVHFDILKQKVSELLGKAPKLS